MKKQTMERIEDILRSYQYDVLSNIVIEQILMLVEEIDEEKI